MKRALLAGAVVAVVFGGIALVGGQGGARVVVGDVPVWFDARGLHRGDVVERTPVEIGRALALVRSGAVYLDPATGDVWFHPWGGDPRVVGHDSAAGPGGDPNGDVAAWFDGSALVVYDTAAGREISRTEQRRHVVADGAGGDHYPPGNGFRQVSAERVVWTDGPRLYSHDLRTRRTSAVRASRKRHVVDVHDEVEVLGVRGALALRAPALAEKRYPALESHVRLSPSGNYVLAVEGTDARHAAAIVDTRTGELWRVPRNEYPWIAWSYGDVALVDTDDALLACNAARRACEPLQAERPFLMPTN